MSDYKNQIPLTVDRGDSYSVVNSSENRVAGVDFYKSHGELIGKEVHHD